MGAVKGKIRKLIQHKKPVSTEQEPKSENYKQKLFQHRKELLIRSVIITAVVVMSALIIKTIVENWEYKKYKVTATVTQEDTLSTSYSQMGDYLLKYTSNGVALLGEDGKSLWSQTYTMTDPTVDVCDMTAVVYDVKGTEMMIVGRNGKIGSVSADMPILKARVAAQGVVAAVLEDGENTWVNFYSTTGEQIATGKTRVDSPGYPVDLAVSPDGMLIMVSYLYVENNKTTSYVAFYNFGNTGQNQMDNMVSGYTYKSVVVPQVQYLSEGKSVGFMDNGFVIYTGKQIPKVGCEVTVEKEIISTFFDESHVGMVFRSEDSEKKYTLVVYNTKGSLVFEENFNIEYTTIKISNDQILMNNDTQLCVFDLKGNQKFNNNLDEGKIHDVFKVGRNRYQVIVDGGIKTIKLS